MNDEDYERGIDAMIAQSDPFDMERLADREPQEPSEDMDTLDQALLESVNEQGRLIAAIRDWADKHDGVPPTSTAWSSSANGYPSVFKVKRVFGSWAAAIETAGFPRPLRGGSRSRNGKPSHARRPAAAVANGRASRTRVASIPKAEEQPKMSLLVADLSVLTDALDELDTKRVALRDQWERKLAEIVLAKESVA